MKVHLLARDETFPSSRPLPYNVAELKTDLCLTPLINFMADGDEIIRTSTGIALLSPLTERCEILYRQAVLSDCLQNSEKVRELYALVQEALLSQEQPHWQFSVLQSVTAQFNCGLLRLKSLLEILRKLRAFSEQNATHFQSEGFQSFLSDQRENLDHEFFQQSDDLVQQLQFKNGMLIGACLSKTGRSFGHNLLRYEPASGTQWDSEPDYYVKESDVKGIADLLHRREIAMSDSNRIMVRAVSYIEDYLRSLQRELAFYVGCLNLQEKLTERGLPTCIPTISPTKQWVSTNLLELNVGLSGEKPVGNNLSLSQDCCVITGADLGGKTTFLKSIGQSQLMLQCGMFVAALQHQAPIVHGVHTHFQREEDRELIYGKFEEELSRMSGIIDHLHREALVLFDESFCSTNEREGSEIAWQVAKALLAQDISVFTVTHLYPFAQRLYDQEAADTAFLCAERLADGTRTKRIVVGPPQRTSFSQDLYQEVFA
ncbi:hypothetical protein REC12_01135 [Desulfosporosinus sp. PR]|uniref:MutS-related protein n=1 Tax=Candidatus Desulfosporosinus nitrosoreducens TaxID=3401928 RepID=UPI0027FCD81A|nr:hypothetical protein [Desulfosporosinus sp. PR]MDQ7092193.1 hypothetical protein [Desulfosporosinus sp. PR]